MSASLKEFLENSTIHGMVFISTSSSRLVKLFWFLVVATGFSCSIFLIVNNLTAWERSPISTTISTLPIRDVEFPAVIVCPPPNTFTGLHLDLDLTRSIQLDNATRTTLLDFIPDAVFDSSFETKYEQFLSFTDTGRSKNWYLGLSTIRFPFKKDEFNFESQQIQEILKLNIETEATSGSVATPFFKQSFKEENFERLMLLSLKININDKFKNSNRSLIIEVDYDIVDFTAEWVRVNSEDLDSNEKRLTDEYPLDFYTYVSFEFYRDMNVKDMEKWENKRNTGMRVRWYYSGDVTTEPQPTDKNKVFTQLANALHEQKDPEGMWVDIKGFRSDFLQQGDIKCEVDDWMMANTFYYLLGFSNFYGNVSTEPIYKDDITENTLDTAAKMYIFLLHCPDLLGTTTTSEVNFFQELYSEHSKETIITTLVQMIARARELENSDRGQIVLRTAKYLFRKTAEELQLYSKDLEILSSSLSDIQENDEMLAHYSLLTPCLHNGTEEYVEEIRDINHPAHILDHDGNLSPSSFIPFCSFGGDLSIMGTDTDMFPIPVCTSFTEKSHNGQLCYEADLNKYKEKVDWQEFLQRGLSFVVDVNEEYNIKKIIFDEATKQNSDDDLLNAFAKSEVLKTFSVHLQTINPVPLVLYGEGNYALTDIKEIKVTEEFFRLGTATTGCERQQYRADCNSARYQEEVAASCSCAPLNLKHFYSSQTPICLHEKVDCVAGISVAGDCLERCEGLIVNVVKTSEPAQDKAGYKELREQYEKYKSPNVSQFTYFKKDLYDLRDLKFHSKLHFVRIFFDTSTFDQVTMDEKAKDVDKLSAIGGTLGLLTGFSIISAVEILFFTLKFAASFLQHHLDWKIKL